MKFQLFSKKRFPNNDVLRSAAIFDNDGDYLPRDVTLRIFSNGQSSYSVYAVGDKYFPSRETWEGKINLTPAKLFECINQCRTKWEDALSEVKATVTATGGGSRVQYVMQEHIDLGRWRTEVEAIGSILADAGKQLLYLVFDAAADLHAKKLFAKLFDHMKDNDLTLTIVSDDFFIPWSFLYIDHHDGVAFDWMRFVGARHVIEHNPAGYCEVTSAKIQATNRFAVSFSHDERIDKHLQVNAIYNQTSFFDSHVGITAKKITKRQDFQDHFSSGQFQDHLVYFFCHGKVGHNGDGTLNLESAELSLTDNSGIKANDLSYWRRQQPLKSNPFVFLNACQSTQPTTVFYQALAPKFLELGANCLIGPQTNIPAMFADEYARRLLSKMLVCKTGDESPRLGIAMRDLVRQFITECQNPLALVYSSHRGTDVRFARRNEVE